MSLEIHTDPDRPAFPSASNEARRDGNWLDKWGACKVCGGEIPHGHSNNCDIFKLECEVRRLRSALERLRDGDFPGTSINAGSSAMMVIEEAVGVVK